MTINSICSIGKYTLYGSLLCGGIAITIATTQIQKICPTPFQGVPLSSSTREILQGFCEVIMPPTIIITGIIGGGVIGLTYGISKKIFRGCL